MHTHTQTQTHAHTHTNAYSAARTHPGTGHGIPPFVSASKQHDQHADTPESKRRRAKRAAQSQGTKNLSKGCEVIAQRNVARERERERERDIHTIPFLLPSQPTPSDGGQEKETHLWLALAHHARPNHVERVGGNGCKSSSRAASHKVGHDIICSSKATAQGCEKRRAFITTCRFNATRAM